MQHDGLTAPPMKRHTGGIVVRASLIALIVVGLVPSAILAVITWGSIADGLVAMNGHMLVVRDYLWMWGAGHFLRSGDVAIIFHPYVFAGEMRKIFDPSLDNFAWSYPPTFLFVAIPAGYLPILSGFALYIISQLILITIAGRLAGLGRAMLLAIMLSPAFIENALGGQNGGITAALLVGGLLLAKRYPVAAGILLGLLTMKPQFGIVIPFCLLASRNWTAIAVAVGTAVALFAASCVVFGIGSWVDFWQQTMPYMGSLARAVWEGRFYQRMMITPFISARSIGFGLNASYCIQIVVSALACLAAFSIWRRDTVDQSARMAVTTCLALLATPYAYNYDMVGLSIAVAVLGSCPQMTAWPERLVLALAWLWPGYAVWASFAGLQPMGVLLIAGVGLIGYKRLGPSAGSQVAFAGTLPLIQVSR